MNYTTPPQSLTSSPSLSTSTTTTKTTRPTLSLDLSNLPALSQPTTPTNTLIITDLNDLHLFDPPSLTALRTTLNNLAPLNSFSPLPSLRRLLCSFHTDSAALSIRKLLSAPAQTNPLRAHTATHSARTVHPKVYFGEPTPLQTGHDARPKLLAAPQVDKLFFISPPPSPPHGWVLRQEDPPNKEVHASDLAHALAKLNTEMSTFSEAATTAPETPVSAVSEKLPRTGSWPVSTAHRRSRSSTLIYHPEDHGGSPGLPAVMVEDLSEMGGLLVDEVDVDGDEDVEMCYSPVEEEGMSVKRMPPKTARPPVELM
ncbi:Calcipressin [Aspergillus indologenus CBS 114.80]|uniref:Calcipressin n=1 Tax=Aspergillus indologenus CBS 114.80 TaxID=1450541 RepID=A0A2V5IM35_9EURO|nr:Calcipressin [Aspergillus indologenus CBS 114.80]